MDAEDEVALAAWILEQEELEAAAVEEESVGEAKEGEEGQQVKPPSLSTLLSVSDFTIIV
jgi:hypothetical protein